MSLYQPTAGYYTITAGNLDIPVVNGYTYSIFIGVTGSGSFDYSAVQTINSVEYVAPMETGITTNHTLVINATTDKIRFNLGGFTNLQVLIQPRTNITAPSGYV